MPDVNPNSYYWNPVAVREALHESAPPVAPIVLHALLDAMWTSQERVEIRSPATAIQVLLGLDRPTYQAAVEALFEAQLLERRYDGCGGLWWVSPLLVQTQAQIHESEAQTKRREQKRRVKEEAVARRLSVRAKTGGQMPSPVPRVRYLTFAERETAAFSDWLPTIQFKSNGQVFVLNEIDRRALSTQFPDQDVGSTLSLLWADLMSKPNRRPTAAGMSVLIERWMTGAQSSSSRRCVDLTAITGGLEDLPDFESEETVK